MDGNTKLIKSLFSKLDADLYALEEESLLKIESLEESIQLLAGKLLEAVDKAGDLRFFCELDEYKEIANQFINKEG